MKSIVVVTTGGTIAMSADRDAGGAIPTLGAVDLSRGLRDQIADVRFEEFTNLPSSHLTLDQIWALSRRIAQLLAEHQVDGVVVTHGTDTLEESAYLCDLTIDSEKPVVFTGAMRLASEVGYDGFANLSSAIRVAADELISGLGTLVVFNDKIHAARYVIKTNTTNIETFQSVGSGPIGFLDYAGVVVERSPRSRDLVPASGLEPSVYLLKVGVGMDTRLLEYLIDIHARGIVVEALGGGRVPPGWLPVLARATSHGSVIVLTSRVGAGRTVDRYAYPGAHRDLVEAGCWFAHGLSGQKARIRLMAALTTPNASAYFDH